MSRLVWDETGKRFYEMGIKNGVLFVFDKKNSKYGTGVPWNGLTSVSENPDGAEATDLWADDQKYASFRSAEDFKGGIEAYTYPDEFEECDGFKEIVPGVVAGQQGRSVFGLSYRTAIGSDTDPEHTQYKLHLVYGATASPSEKSYETINDSPDAITFSWDFETTPVPVNLEGFNPTAHIEIDSRKIEADKLKAIEDLIYGTNDKESTLPMPDEIYKLLTADTSSYSNKQDAAGIPVPTAAATTSDKTAKS